jgi:hypothetical protein
MTDNRRNEERHATLTLSHNAPLRAFRDPLVEAHWHYETFQLTLREGHVSTTSDVAQAELDRIYKGRT